MNAPDFYSSNPVRDADAHYDRLTRLEDACAARAAYILATPAELQYVVENQNADIWGYLRDIVDAVKRIKANEPYAEHRLIQTAKGLTDMLEICAGIEVETYEPDDGRDE